MKLTKTTIDKLVHQKEGSKKDIRWDAALPGFGVCVYPSGRKSFVIFYRQNGRQHLMTVGQFGVMTVEEARKQAKILLASTLSGDDPLGERQGNRNGIKLKVFAKDYISRHAKQHKKSWLQDERRLDNYVLPALGNHQLQSIRKIDIVRLHHEITTVGTPVEANRVLRLISVMFTCAKDWGYLEGENPCMRIKLNKEQRRERWVSSAELPQLAKAIDAEESVYARAAIWLYLLTGLRKLELLRAKWEDVNFDACELRLPETKSGKPHHVPLSLPAVQILRKIPKQEGNPYIFCGAKAACPLYDIRKPWNRIKKAAGIEDVQLHDLRRTVGSWMAQAGNSLHLIGKVLNHRHPNTTAIYAHFAEDSVRDALESHGRKIMRVAGKDLELAEDIA